MSEQAYKMQKRRKNMGGSGIFSRRGGGGGDFQEIFENFVDFFLVDCIDFPRSPKALNRICLSQTKKAFLSTFWKILTKKSRFFGNRFPLIKLLSFFLFYFCFLNNFLMKTVVRIAYTTLTIESTFFLGFRSGPLTAERAKNITMCNKKICFC